MPRLPRQRYYGDVESSPTPVAPRREKTLPKRPLASPTIDPEFQRANALAVKSGLASDPMASGTIMPRTGPRGNESELLDAAYSIASQAMGVRMAAWVKENRPTMDDSVGDWYNYHKIEEWIDRVLDVGRPDRRHLPSDHEYFQDKLGVKKMKPYKKTPRWYETTMRSDNPHLENAKLLEANARLTGVAGTIGKAPEALGKVMKYINSGRPVQDPDFRAIPTPKPTKSSTTRVRKARQ